jgi:hypothetical protein
MSTQYGTRGGGRFPPARGQPYTLAGSGSSFRVRETQDESSVTVDLGLDGLPYDPSTSPYEEEGLGETKNTTDPLPISWTVLQILLVLAYTVYIFLPQSWFHSFGDLYHISTKVLLHDILYAMISVISLCMYYRGRRSRRRGFLKFYRSVHHLQRVPFFTLTVGNALLLPLWRLYEAEGGSNGGGEIGQSDILLMVVAVIEALIIVTSSMYYCHRVLAYNRSNAVPDYQALLNGGREDLEEAQEDPHVVVRYQADMIKFLEVKVKDLKNQLLAMAGESAKQQSKTSQRTVRDEDVLQLVHERDELRNQLKKQMEVARRAGVGAAGTPAAMDPSHLKEKVRLQQTVKELRRRLKRVETELEVEREAHQAAQAFLDQYRRDGNTSSSALDD